MWLFVSLLPCMLLSYILQRSMKVAAHSLRDSFCFYNSIYLIPTLLLWSCITLFSFFVPFPLRYSLYSSLYPLYPAYLVSLSSPSLSLYFHSHGGTVIVSSLSFIPFITPRLETNQNKINFSSLSKIALLFRLLFVGSFSVFVVVSCCSFCFQPNEMNRRDFLSYPAAILSMN